MDATPQADQGTLLTAELANLSYGATAALRGGSRPSMAMATLPMTSDQHLNNYMNNTRYTAEVKQQLSTVSPATNVSAAPAPPASGGFVQPRLYQPDRNFENPFKNSKPAPPRKRKRNRTKATEHLPPPPSRYYPAAPNLSNPAPRRANTPAALGIRTRTTAAVANESRAPLRGLAMSKYASVPPHVRILMDLGIIGKARKGAPGWRTCMESDNSVTCFMV